MIWLPIDGFTEYHVSDNGDIRKGEMIMKTVESHCGYLRITLCNNGIKKTFFVHRLVASAFIPNNDQGKNLVNHKNSNRKDNRSVNLEWVNHSENAIHSYENGRRNHNDEKVVAIDDTGEIVACFRSGADAARMFNVHKSSIWKSVRTGKKCSGYRWIRHVDS